MTFPSRSVATVNVVHRSKDATLNFRRAEAYPVIRHLADLQRRAAVGRHEVDAVIGIGDGSNVGDGHARFNGGADGVDFGFRAENNGRHRKI